MYRIHTVMKIRIGKKWLVTLCMSETIWKRALDINRSLGKKKSE